MPSGIGLSLRFPVPKTRPRRLSSSGGMVTGKQEPAMHEDFSTEEEIRMSTPYSDVEAWKKILIGQLASGTTRFRGPPGLLEQMESLWSSSTEQERISLYLG